MGKTFYIPVAEVVNRNVAESYRYRRDKEDLGLLFYTIDDDKWHVLDYMNNIENIFDTEKQAKAFIKDSTPVKI